MYEFGSTICYCYSPVSMQKKKNRKEKKTHDCKFIKHIKSHFETADQIFFFLAFPPNFVSYHLFHIEVSWSHFVRYY